jgi:PAS domain S-box-containing protein
MKDEEKSKKKTLNELEQLRQRVAELESEVEECRRLPGMAQEYHNIVERSQDMIAVVDQDYRYLLVNSRFLEFRGLNKGQVVGKLVEEVVGRDVFEKEVKERLEACLRGASIQYVMKYTCPGSGEREVLVSYSPIEDSDGIHRVVSTTRDITDYRRAEDTLLKTEERLNLALDAAYMGVWEWNIQTNAIIWSPECYKIYGVKSSDKTFKSFINLLHPEDADRIKTMIDKALADRTAQASEYRIIRPSGEVVWISDLGQVFFDETGKPLRMVGIVQDITERKRAEVALRESEERLRLLFDEAPVGYHEVDTEGRVIRINRTELDLLGYSLEDVIGRPVWKLCADEEAVINAFQDKIAGKMPPNRAFERTYRRKDGTSLPVLSEDRILTDEDGRISGIRTTIQDITERKRGEDALRKNEVEALRLARENAVLARIGRAISSSLEIENVFATFSEEVRHILPVDRLAICLIDDDDYTRVELYSVPSVTRCIEHVTAIPYGGTLTEYVARTRQSIALTLEDRDEVARRFPGVVYTFDAGLRSFLAVPLFSRDRVVGVLHIQSIHPWFYDEGHLRLAESIGSQIAGAVDRARLFGEHRRVSEALIEEQKKYHELFDEAPVGYHELDAEGRIVRVNRTEQEMLGYLEDEMVGRFGWEFIAEREESRRAYGEKIAGMRLPGLDFERTFLRKDGTSFPVVINDRPLRDRGGRTIGMRSTVQDITERKKVEEALRESEERFRQLFDEAPVGYHEVDTEGRVIRINQTELDLLGYSLEDVIGQPIWRLCVDEKVVINAFQDKIAGKMPPSRAFERSYRRKDGTPLPVLSEDRILKDGEGKITGIRTTIQDITERKRGEEALQKSEQRTRTFLQGSPIPAFVIDKDHKILYWNTALEALSGIKAEEVIGTSQQWKAFYAEDRPCIADLLVDEAADAVPQWYGSKCTKSKLIEEAFEGTDFFPALGERGKWLRYTAAVMRGDRGEIIGTLETLEDATERKRADELIQIQHDLILALSAATSLEEGLRLCVEAALHASEMDCGGVYLSGKAAGSLDLVFQKGLSPGFVSAVSHYEPGSPNSELVMAGKPVYTNRQKLEPLFEHVENSEKLLALAVLPICHEGRVIGCLNVGSHLLDEVLSSSRVALEAIAAQIGSSIARLKAESALRASEEKYRLLVENANEAIFVSRDRRLEFANSAFVKLLGYPREELISRPVMDFVHPEDQEMVRENHMKRLRGDAVPPVYPLRIVDKGGIAKWVAVSAVKITWGERPGILNFLTDITQRKQAEDALKGSEEKYRSLVEGAGWAIFTMTRDGVYLFINDFAAKALGGKPEDIVGKTMWDLFPKDVADLQMADVRKVIDTGVGEVVEAESSLRGERCWLRASIQPLLDGSGRCDSALIIADDITERIKAEQDRLLLATAVEQADETVVITDTHGFIQYVNPAFERVTGYERQEMIGQDVRILKSGKHEKGYYRDLWAAITTGQSWKGHFINKRKDGILFEEEATISPIKNKAGAITSFVAVKRDVTHELELQKQLRIAQKHEALGTLAGGIAHDFNNILGGIVGYADLARIYVAKNRSVDDFIDQILKASSRAQALVQQILTMARQKEQVKIPVEVHLIVNEVLRLIRSVTPSTIRIEQNIDPKSGTVMADPSQIHQLLVNLCSNANYAMRDRGGVLVITLRNVEVNETEALKNRRLKRGEYVSLVVADTGHGMDAKTMERIFDPYFTTKAPGEGTGIGLSVVKGIVEGYGGAITVESEPGAGTTFEVSLPCVSVPRAEVAEEHGEDLKGNERVLLVDDEAQLVSVEKYMLEHLGYKVTGCTQSTEALQLFCAHPDEFDVVVTDQTMPAVTGIHLAREIHAFRPDMPIVLCTGYSDQVNRENAEQYGITEFLAKPLSLLRIGKAVRRALQKKDVEGTPHG